MAAKKTTEPDTTEVVVEVTPGETKQTSLVENDGELVVPEVQVEEPVTVTPTTKTGRVRGSWDFQFGTYKQSFVDGTRYELPLDVYNYLAAKGSLYDWAD